MTKPTTKTSNTDRYVIIMAGGRGERFWPVSRQKTPKQLIALLGKRSFLQEAVDRVLPLVSLKNILVITNEVQAPQVAKPYKTTFHRAERFVEKPHFDRAVEYVNSGQYRWNAGMFIWGFVTITEGLQKHQPQMYEACQRWFKVANQPAKLARALAR